MIRTAVFYSAIFLASFSITGMELLKNDSSSSKAASEQPVVQDYKIFSQEQICFMKSVCCKNITISDGKFTFDSLEISDPLESFSRDLAWVNNTTKQGVLRHYGLFGMDHPYKHNELIYIHSFMVLLANVFEKKDANITTFKKDPKDIAHRISSFSLTDWKKIKSQNT